jgi:vacuolar-type H+-ATPase subunit E/Vma4
MTRFAGVLHHQVQKLQDALRRQQEARCREIIANAERQSKQAIHDSRQKLFERRRRAVSEERQRRAHELLIAKSRIETQERRRAFAQHEKVLHEAWPLLLETLEKRWADDGQRRAWCEMIVAEASGTLMGSDWIVEHPGSLAKKDRDAIARRLQQLQCAPATFVACDDITSGLRIRVGDACVDGTIEGLLGSRHDVEAQLLAAWEQLDGSDHG